MFCVRSSAERSETVLHFLNIFPAQSRKTPCKPPTLITQEGIHTMPIVFFNDPARLQKLILLMLDSMTVTLKIFLLTLILSIPLGLLISQGRMSKRWYIQKPVSFYIYIMRGTPLMLQILFIFFAMPYILPVKLDRFYAAIFAFTINYAAYFAEIFRAGLQSIPVGQREAGRVLGYTKPQIFFRILLPQVIKRVLPPMTSEVITLVKDTALASIIAVTELLTVAKKQVSGSSSFEPYIIAAILYLIFNGVAEQLCKYAERKLDYYQ